MYMYMYMYVCMYIYIYIYRCLFAAMEMTDPMMPPAAAKYILTRPGVNKHNK